MGKRVNAYIAESGGRLQHTNVAPFFTYFNVVHFLTNKTCREMVE
jgi:hypothetical protein